MTILLENYKNFTILIAFKQPSMHSFNQHFLSTHSVLNSELHAENNIIIPSHFHSSCLQNSSTSAGIGIIARS